MTRPECWDFAMDFLGWPEDEIVEAYVAGLEARLAKAEQLLDEILETTDDNWIETYIKEYKEHD